jgi:hypothetical protein
MFIVGSWGRATQTGQLVIVLNSHIGYHPRGVLSGIQMGKIVAVLQIHHKLTQPGHQ